MLTSLAVLSYLQNKDTAGDSYILRAMKTGAMKRDNFATLGFYLLAANKNKEAAYYYEKAIAISPDSFDSYYLASAYAKLNDIEKAISALVLLLRTATVPDNRLKMMQLLTLSVRM